MGVPPRTCRVIVDKKKQMLMLRYIVIQCQIVLHLVSRTTPVNTHQVV